MMLFFEGDDNDRELGTSDIHVDVPKKERDFKELLGRC